MAKVFTSASWAPEYSRAADEIAQETTKVSYVSKDDIELQNTADHEPWIPCSYIEELVPGSANITIELLTKNVSSLNNINLDLREAKDVGIVIMGPLHRKLRPALILLTTGKKIYAIDGNDMDYGITFFRIKLTDDKISFWTTNGVQEAESLYHNYSIDLSQHNNVNCCTGLHVSLMQTMRRRPRPILELYPNLATLRTRTRIQIERFGSLVEKWLDISEEDFHFDSAKLIHLASRPLNLTAQNIIKKRCLLVRPLAQTLNHCIWKEPRVMSKNSFRALTLGEEDDIQLTIRKLIEKYQNRGEAHLTFYMHLDLGIKSFLWN